MLSCSQRGELGAGADGYILLPPTSTSTPTSTPPPRLPPRLPSPLHPRLPPRLPLPPTLTSAHARHPTLTSPAEERPACPHPLPPPEADSFQAPNGSRSDMRHLGDISHLGGGTRLEERKGQLEGIHDAGLRRWYACRWYACRGLLPAGRGGVGWEGMG